MFPLGTVWRVSDILHRPGPDDKKDRVEDRITDLEIPSIPSSAAGFDILPASYHAIGGQRLATSTCFFLSKDTTPDVPALHAATTCWS